MRAEFSNKTEIVSHRSTRPGTRLTTTQDRPDRKFHTSHHQPQPRHREENWSGPRDAVLLSQSDIFALPPGSRIVNMPVRIDADGTMTPIPHPSLNLGIDISPANSFRENRRPVNRDRSRSPPPQMHGEYAPPPATHGNYGPSAMGEKLGDPTLLTCFNLPNNFSVDDIATLFGVYGDVVRVKKSSRNERQCWVQFRTADGAQNILRFLNNLTLFGRDLSIEYSTVQRLRLGPDPERDKSFDTSYHRYQTRDAEFFRKHLCSPTNVLFISNIPASMSEVELTSAFDARSVEFLRDSIRPLLKSAFVHFSNVDDAANALIENHGKLLNETSTVMSLSFSQRRQRRH